jgi:pyridoxamine 5'-phosphate oxidase
MELYLEAIDRFRNVLEEAKKTELREPTAATLATADAEGYPTARTIILKAFDERGLTFYTNTHSRKGQQIASNPRAAVCFFWQPLMQQVLVEGTVEIIDAAEADAFWVTRPRDSQFAAWASKQSEPLDSPQTLRNQCAEYHEKFKDQQVPRPPNWSGYRVIPERIEFWKTGWYRLHERISYSRSSEGWSKTLLYP